MERRAMTVRGIVQGVGFRPFVYALACRWGLSGFVRNRHGSVELEVEGTPAALDCFLADVKAAGPPLSRVDSLDWKRCPLRGTTEFVIEESCLDGESPSVIPPDAAICRECLAELFDPSSRRFGYPFVNCAHCGPRLTIVCSGPYDRARTTMARFAMCGQCRAEYEDPADRRFHAQPIACPACGPRLAAWDSDGTPIATPDPLSAFAAALQAGRIGALKGLGGFHLTCDASNSTAVRQLRTRKQREEKPFAIMVATLADVQRLCEVSAAEAALLTSPAAPIVLLRARPAASTLLAGDDVAPRNPWLGVMLPYTPLHHLLCRKLAGRALVMTSGNRSDEPIAQDNDEAVRRLAGIADMFLGHDRPIQVRCDDSVLRVVAGVPLPIRMSRGYAPITVTLPGALARPTLAVGGQFKGTFALGADESATVSHHLGDLDHLEAHRAFERDVRLYEELLGVRPQVIAHDLHPDYVTTLYAQRRARDDGLRLLAVQHHHAHMASCMAEHGLTERSIGVVFDGTGYGTDGAVWGGEFLIGDYVGFERVGHLRYVAMPGGEAAIRQPWRMALAHWLDAGLDPRELPFRDELPEGPAARDVEFLTRIIQRRIPMPRTSSMGRLFDAVAALTGVRQTVRYEGQAAMELEWGALPPPTTAPPYPFLREQGQIDTRPLIAALAEDLRAGAAQGWVATRFHATVVEMIVATCRALRTECLLNTVVLSGGVFLNDWLATVTVERLTESGFRVHRHRILPPGDGGLALGQLAIAAGATST